MGDVSRVMIGDGRHVSNNSGIVIEVVDGDMLNGRRRMRYREVTAYRSIGSCCSSWIKKWWCIVFAKCSVIGNKQRLRFVLRISGYSVLDSIAIAEGDGWLIGITLLITIKSPIRQRSPRWGFRCGHISVLMLTTFYIYTVFKLWRRRNYLGSFLVF